MIPTQHAVRNNHAPRNNTAAPAAHSVMIPRSRRCSRYPG